MAQQIYMRYPGGLKKALTLSYDDGVEQDIRLIEILDKHGIKATFNINSGSFAPEGTVYDAGTIHRRMTEKQVYELYSRGGHEIAVHGLNHPHLEVLSRANMTYEVLQDRVNLERMFGCLVRGMAYPYGTTSDELVDTLRACGISYSRTTVSTERFDLPHDWLRMPATCHHKNPRLTELANQFLNANVWATPMLFYLWGHSYEFEADNNWNVIEEFAELMGGREDVWYATNGEIYDYVKDYERLIWAADEHIVHNPTNRTLFFKYGKTDVKLSAGETREIED